MLKNFLVKILLFGRHIKSKEKKTSIAKLIKKFPDYKICNLGKKNANKIFYVIKRSEPSRGGFFANFFFVLNHLIFCERLNFIPIIDMQNFSNFYKENKLIDNTKNSWEYYFKNVSHYKLSDVYQSKRVVFSNEKYTEEMIESPLNLNKRKNLLKVFRKYIKINKKIINKADLFIKKNFKNNKVLGIHWRGSDYKVAPGHPFPPTKKQIFNLVDNLLKKEKIKKIFLVTEEINYLDLLKKRYNKKLFYLESYRVYSRFNFIDYPRKNHRYKLGLELLTEVIILSKLSHLIYCDSNISDGVIFLSKNKNLKKYMINNGKNSKSLISSLFLWYLKSKLPNILGGFKNNFN